MAKAKKETVVVDADEALRKESDQLRKPTIPSGAWCTFIIYNLNFSENVIKAADFQTRPPSITEGFTIRMAIVRYITKVGGKDMVVKTVSTEKDEKGKVTDAKLLIDDLYIKAYNTFNNNVLSFNKIKKPTDERSGIIAYARALENMWNIPISYGVEMLVKFINGKKNDAVTLKDFPVIKEEKLPPNGLGIMFQAYKVNSSYISKKDNKKQMKTVITTYDPEIKKIIETEVIIASPETTDAVYALVVKMEEESKKEKEKKEKEDTSFKYGANISDAEIEEEYQEVEEEEEET